MSSTAPESTSATPTQTIVVIGSARWVVGSLLAAMTGLTRRAIDGKRAGGYWLEGQHWRKADDGTIWYCVEAIEQWVEKGPA